MINTNPYYWNGCYSMGANRRFGATGKPDVPLKTWLHRCVPTYSQKSDDCVGHGWANWLEVVLREYVRPDAIPDGCQINGYAVWFQIKQMFYGGRLYGGAHIHEGFYALKALGWIPRDSVLVEVGYDWESQGEALMNSPLVVGHMVHAGWFTPNPQNGCLDHSKDPTDYSAGHCTCRIGRMIQEDRRFFLGQNSWGEKWAWNGCFLMDEDMDAGTALGNAYTVSIPGGFERLIDLHSWKSGIISTPYDNQIQLP